MEALGKVKLDRLSNCLLYIAQICVRTAHHQSHGKKAKHRSRMQKEKNGNFCVVSTCLHVFLFPSSTTSTAQQQAQLACELHITRVSRVKQDFALEKLPLSLRTEDLVCNSKAPHWMLTNFWGQTILIPFHLLLIFYVSGSNALFLSRSRTRGFRNTW